MSAEPDPFAFDAKAFVAAAPPEDCPRCKRDSCAGDCRQRPSAQLEAAPAFLARVEGQGEPSWLVHELIPDEGIALWHGRPRSYKSLAALDTALALAAGQPAFHVERFAVPEAVPVAYLCEEDPARLIAFRLKLMLVGRGLTEAPAGLLLCARPGWNLETAGGQSAFVAALQAAPVPPRLLVVDPARASFPSFDGGPKDAAPAVAFLRTLMRETSIRVILLVHHDVKPSRDGQDGRPRAEQAAGGAIFSVSDCPVGFTRQSDREAFAEPCSYKLGADPAPFRIVAETGSDEPEGFREFLRLSAETRSVREQTNADVERRILGVLDDADDWINQSALADEVKAKKQTVVATLIRLVEDGKVSVRDAARGAKEYRRGLVS